MHGCAGVEEKRQTTRSDAHESRGGAESNAGREEHARSEIAIQQSFSRTHDGDQQQRALQRTGAYNRSMKPVEMAGSHLDGD